MIILFTERNTSGQFVLNIVLLTYGHKQSEQPKLCTDSNSQGYIQLLTSTICHYKQQTFALFLVLFEVHIPSNTRMTAQQLKYNARGQSSTATIACFFFPLCKTVIVLHSHFLYCFDTHNVQQNLTTHNNHMPNFMHFAMIQMILKCYQRHCHK